MKNLLKIALLVFIGCFLATSEMYAKVKEKKVSYAKCAYYFGPVEKKTPAGPGKLVINEGTENMITITGTFNDMTITEAVVEFAKQGVTFKGKVTYDKKTEMLLLIPIPVIHIQLSDGGFYKNGTDDLIGKLTEHPVILNIDCSFGIATFSKVSGELLTLDDKYDNLIEQAKIFSGCSEYTFENGNITQFSLASDKFTIGNTKQPGEPTILLFENRAKAILPLHNEDTVKLSRANGDYIEFTPNGRLSDYHITFDNGYIKDTLVSYLFDNGNTYLGSVKEGLVPSTYTELINFNNMEWSWNKFCDYANYGTLTYADSTGYTGKFDKKGFNGSDRLENSSYIDGVVFDKYGNRTVMINGMTGQEFAAIEAERKAQKEREEAEKLAKYNKAKASDYFKLDDNGNIIEFLHTYPDLAQHKYVGKKGAEVKNTISYPDGTIMEIPGYIDNETYKELISLKSAPDYQNPTILGKRIFTDGLTIQSGGIYHGSFHMNGNLVIEEPKKPNGDYAVLLGHIEYDENSSEQIMVSEMRKTFKDYIIVYEKDKRVEYPNGNVYKGRYDLISDGKSPLMEDSRIKALKIDIVSSYDNITGVRLTYGVMYNQGGKIIEIYINGRKLEGFDFETERIKIQKSGLDKWLYKWLYV